MGVKQNLIRNAYTVWYLMTLRRAFDGDTEKIKADQDRKIYRLMKRAYRIPVYRAKFEQSGTTPEDYHSAEDLVKFPTLTKPEFRNRMSEAGAVLSAAGLVLLAGTSLIRRRKKEAGI